jgi:electron transfer flavoprotein beta subunit
MNIVVCVKQVADINIPIELETETGSIVKEELAYLVNPYDMLAVEAAVRIKAKTNGQVILLSLGEPSAETALRKCLALGADRAILICDPALADSDGYATATVLAKAIAFFPYDLVLCGVRAIDTNAGQVGSAIAAMLDIALVIGVTKIEVPAEPKKAIIQRKLEGGNREVVETPLPALLTVEAGLNKPTYPGLPSVIAAQRGEIERYDIKGLGLSPNEVGPSGARTQTVRLAPAKPRPKKIFTPDSNLPAAERMRLIMSGGIAERKGGLLEGEPAELASKLIQFLKQEKLLPQ